ncbi:hypothetical protein Micbo1qcDRAFT_177571 [Microdochium bolleyi]|uniref:Uncharacterized protein n=1 Tax=Microdochium bolleyi TaxID=196109 RepID=A0A136IW34_9PEZI|nr:hypothetical protein Micbo1qcDRAFT_177571 [Microdochium bolleyi]
MVTETLRDSFGLAESPYEGQTPMSFWTSLLRQSRHRSKSSGVIHNVTVKDLLDRRCKLGINEERIGAYLNILQTLAIETSSGGIPAAHIGSGTREDGDMLPIAWRKENFDPRYGHVSKNRPRHKILSSLQEASWYTEVLDENGCCDELCQQQKRDGGQAHTGATLVDPCAKRCRRLASSKSARRSPATMMSQKTKGGP